MGWFVAGAGPAVLRFALGGWKVSDIQTIPNQHSLHGRARNPQIGLRSTVSEMAYFKIVININWLKEALAHAQDQGYTLYRVDFFVNRYGT